MYYAAQASENYMSCSDFIYQGATSGPGSDLDAWTDDETPAFILDLSYTYDDDGEIVYPIPEATYVMILYAYDYNNPDINFASERGWVKVSY